MSTVLIPLLDTVGQDIIIRARIGGLINTVTLGAGRTATNGQFGQNGVDIRRDFTILIEDAASSIEYVTVAQLRLRSR